MSIKRTSIKSNIWRKIYNSKKRVTYAKIVNKNKRIKEAEAIKKIMDIIG